MEFRSFSVDYGVLEILSLGKEDNESGTMNSNEDLGDPLSSTRNSLFLFYNRLPSRFPLNQDSIFCLRQVHSNQIYSTDQILEFQSRSPGLYLEGDGLYTRKEGVVLGIRTADCVPLFIWDEKNPLIAALHIGWRGAKLGILQAFLQSLPKEGTEYGFYIGPCIRGDHYEVGEEVAEFFFPWEGVVKRKSSSHTSAFLLDLPGFVKQVISKWRPDSLICDSGEDTYQSKRWYSHRCGESARNLHGIRFFTLSASYSKKSWNQP